MSFNQAQYSDRFQYQMSQYTVLTRLEMLSTSSNWIWKPISPFEMQLNAISLQFQPKRLFLGFRLNSNQIMDEKLVFQRKNRNESRFRYNIFQWVFGLDFVLFSNNFPLKLLICIASALCFEVFLHSIGVSIRFELSDSDQFLYQYQILLWILFAHKEMKKW